MDPRNVEDERDAWNRVTLDIRELWRDPTTEVVWTNHIQDKMDKRSINAAQVSEAMDFGGVTTRPRPSDKPGLKKYRLDNFTQGSDNRRIGAVAEVDFVKRIITMITTMWLDEKQTCEGTFQ